MDAPKTLTLENVYPPSEGWNIEAILALPLPEKPSVELLTEARKGLLFWLDFLTWDGLWRDDREALKTEYDRTANRMFEISERLFEAQHDRAQQDLAEEREQRQREWRQPQRQSDPSP